MINANILSFPTSTGKFLFRAYLTGNGTQAVELDNLALLWMENIGDSGYVLNGSLVSSAFNLSKPSPLSSISWTQDTSTCSNCSVKFQIRTAPLVGVLPGQWSSWYGSGGKDTYFDMSTGNLIPQILNWNNWVQYRVLLTGDGRSTPVLKETFVNYK